MSNFQNPTRMSEIVAETFCGRLSELRRSQLIARVTLYEIRRMSRARAAHCT